MNVRVGGFEFIQYDVNNKRWKKEELIRYFKERGWEIQEHGEDEDGPVEYLVELGTAHEALVEQNTNDGSWELVCYDSKSRLRIKEIQDDSMIVWAWNNEIAEAAEDFQNSIKSNPN